MLAIKLKGMPRQPRYFIPHFPQHVITRGVNRQPVFFQRQDYDLYRQALHDAATDSGCHVHAYVLMTNHVHLLVTPTKERALPQMMQAMGRNYVQRLNKRYQRTGTLWEGRYKASLIQTDHYLLACQRYIELNPVRAGIVILPDAYPYSSYRHHAYGKTDPLITSHNIYIGLNANAEARQNAYRRLCSEALSQSLLDTLRTQTNSCTTIGNKQFRTQIAAMLGHELPTGKRGRPKKPGSGSNRFFRDYGQEK